MVLVSLYSYIVSNNDPEALTANEENFEIVFPFCQEPRISTNKNCIYVWVCVCVCWYHVHNNWNENNNEIDRQQLERIVFNEFTQFTGEFIDVNRLE